MTDIAYIGIFGRLVGINSNTLMDLVKQSVPVNELFVIFIPTEKYKK